MPGARKIDERAFQSRIEALTARVSAGELTEAQFQEELQRLLREAGEEATRSSDDSVAVDRIRELAHRARSIA